MASVNAPIRRILKPILRAFFGDKTYLWFQLYGKIRDIRHRLVEEDEMELLDKFISSQDQVIDIGANYAYYTTRMAALCKKGEVFAFEPISSTFWVCQKIVKLFRLKNVRLFEKGVGAKTEILTFEVPLQAIGVPSAGQAHLSGRNNKLPGSKQYYSFTKTQSMQCEVVALDDDIWFSRFSKLSFIKIDIEGAEIFALKGMKKLISKHRPAILIEVVPLFLQGFGVSEFELAKWIGDLGYEFFTYEKKLKLLRAHQGEFTDRNYILLPKEKRNEFSEMIERN